MNRIARISSLVLLLGMGTRAITEPGARADKGNSAHVTSARGTVLGRTAEGKWQVLQPKAEAAAGHTVLGLPGAAIESANRAVRLEFHPDLSGTSPLPIIETAVILKPAATGTDLDVALDRGRIELINMSAGKAKAVVRIHDVPITLDLNEPGATVAVELYGRWAKGAPFTLDAKPDEGPAWQSILIVLKGQVDVQCRDQMFAMHAPPGAALIEWDSAGGGEVAPRFLKGAPEWANDDTSSPRAQKRVAVLKHLQRAITEKSLDDAIDELLNSDDPTERRAAVYAMGAMDDLPRLGHALSNANHADVWDAGVIALRHWIGRGPGQDQKLYHGLIDKAHYSKVDAESVLELLHSYGDEDLARPETYEVLVDYLKSDRLPIRGLAYWHLERLVPGGKSIGYNPMDPKEKRDQAAAKWRELIPAGQLPKPATTGGNS